MNEPDIVAERVRIVIDESVWSAQELAGRKYGVSPHIHHMDFMYGFMVHHAKTTKDAVDNYFGSGDRLAKAFAAVINECGFDFTRETRILDFASGYGRVTRHLQKYFVRSKIVASDVHEGACRFNEQLLGVQAQQSNRNPATTNLLGSYDAICAMSFFTHMPEETFGPWLARLWGALAPGGILMFSTRGPHRLIDEQRLPEYEQCLRDGHVYWPQSEQYDLDLLDYGAATVTPSYVAKQLKLYTWAESTSRVENGWDSVQDLYIVKRSSDG